MKRAYRFKSYCADTCKNQCNKLPKRIIHRSEYLDAVDLNNNIKQKPQYYKQRQAILKHPFGPSKGFFGYTHTLNNGIKKVKREMNLILFCYNFMRIRTYFGSQKMLTTIQNWKPDYRKIDSTKKNGFVSSILIRNAPRRNLNLLT